MPPDTFETARLLLRPVIIMDVDAIFGSYAQDEEVVRYLIWRPHRSRSETQAYVERCMATPSEVERTTCWWAAAIMLSGEHLRCANVPRTVSIAAMCWHVPGGDKA